MVKHPVEVHREFFVVGGDWVLAGKGGVVAVQIVDKMAELVFPKKLLR